MASASDRQNSILIVSASEQFLAAAKRAVSGKHFSVIDHKKSAANARREIYDRNYDIVLICAPLPDEMGHELALDISERSDASVILVVPGEIREDVTDSVIDDAVYVMAKPVDYMRLGRAIRFFLAVQGRIRKYEKKAMKLEDKMEEIRVVNRAKLYLMEKKGMSEDDAHRYIGKQAMDRGLTRKQVAEEIVS